MVHTRAALSDLERSNSKSVSSPAASPLGIRKAKRFDRRGDLTQVSYNQAQSQWPRFSEEHTGADRGPKGSGLKAHLAGVKACGQHGRLAGPYAGHERPEP